MSASNPADAVRRLLERALAAHRRGDLDAAEQAYAAVLQIDAAQVDALHMSGMLHHQRGDAERALALLDRAAGAATSAQSAAVLANRASVRLARADFAAAADDARLAIARDAQSFGAWFNLGLALRAQQQPAGAASAFARASALRPQHARALLEWFLTAASSQQSAGIAQRLRAPLPALAPERRLALDTAWQLTQHGQAGPAWVVLSQLRRELPDDTEVRHRHEIERAYGAVGLLEQQGSIDAALAATEALLQDVPAHRATRMLRAGLFAERGEVEAALTEYRCIAEAVPDDAVAGSAALIAMQHAPALSADAIAEAHRTWAARYMAQIAPRWPAQLPHADPGRALRIGWLSPRFFSGLVANLFLGVLEKFDRGEARHVLYDCGGVEDEATARFRAAADEWRRVDELDDLALCESIRADRIDVLVELSGHSPGNRLRALGLRPAPVQIAWLDYFHSTGTRAIDVLISDAVLSSPRLAHHYSEHLLRLPSGRLCWSPPQDAPAIVPRNGAAIRFASFNRINKLNDEVLAAWSRILAGVPGSVLRLKARALDRADERAHFLARCARHGITADRLELLGYGTPAQALAAYADVDIALDPFPFSGCATSFDALWMGLPVITWQGETMVSRQSASLLTALGLDELIAENVDDYVRGAIALADDAAWRGELRGGLRERVLATLGDVDRHVNELSAVLREAWRLWCGGKWESGISE
jgi:predicted O-linked N-acetylglucosamine transferase (SPINDLY family)